MTDVRRRMTAGGPVPPSSVIRYSSTVSRDLSSVRRHRSSVIRHPCAAFTVVEILVVVVIIGMLCGLLLPSLMGAKQSARVAASRATLEALRGALEQYASRFGDYPPSSLAAFKLTVNETNNGIESATACLATTAAGRHFLEGVQEDRFANTDNDTASRNPTKWFFGDNRLREVTDDWGNPFIYFHFADYPKPDKMAKYQIDGRVQVCRPQKSPATGAYHSSVKFQLWSAGPDGTNHNGNEDDIVGW